MRGVVVLWEGADWLALSSQLRFSLQLSGCHFHLTVLRFEPGFIFLDVWEPNYTHLKGLSDILAGLLWVLLWDDGFYVINKENTHGDLHIFLSSFAPWYDWEYGSGLDLIQMLLLHLYLPPLSHFLFALLYSYLFKSLKWCWCWTGMFVILNERDQWVFNQRRVA